MAGHFNCGDAVVNFGECVRHQTNKTAALGSGATINKDLSLSFFAFVNSRAQSINHTNVFAFRSFGTKHLREIDRI